MSEREKKGKFMKRMLVVNITFAACYTTGSLYVLYKTGMEAPSLTAGVFAYIGSSGGMMAYIKSTKIKNPEGKVETKKTSNHENKAETVQEDTAG